jgi:hypothetical protein
MSSEIAIIGSQIFPEGLESVSKVNIKRSRVLHVPLQLFKTITGPFRRIGHNRRSVASLTNDLLENDDFDG